MQLVVLYTDIALAAGSDKTVHVFDINAGRCVRVMTDVHTRAVHHIAQNQVTINCFLFHSSFVRVRVTEHFYCSMLSD